MVQQIFLFNQLFLLAGQIGIPPGQKHVLLYTFLSTPPGRVRTAAGGAALVVPDECCHATSATDIVTYFALAAAVYRP